VRVGFERLIDVVSAYASRCTQIAAAKEAVVVPELTVALSSLRHEGQPRLVCQRLRAALDLILQSGY